VSDDARFMREAIRLARRGLGRTSPNPPVGAVVVAGGRIVGRGYHRLAGAPHGEAAALQDAGARAKGATLYVTLEPCNHYGRTPPCTEAVIASGVKRVVMGLRDPNPNVKGGGIARLRRRGLRVDVGVEEGRCAEIIRYFTKHSRTGLPYVTLKLAASLDGRIATTTGESRWITSGPARRMVHRLRNEHDAVMVGAGSVRADDPVLTCRMRGGRDPVRVVVSGRLRLPLGAQILNGALAPDTIVATATHKPAVERMLRARGVTMLVQPGTGGIFSLRKLLTALGRRDISSVLIEGGAELAAAALREHIVDELLCFLAPKLIGGDGRSMLAALGISKLSRAIVLDDMRLQRVGPDLLLSSHPTAADIV
jgi:diaminohydroxyphosphoribosylaminopyrimidine deaminase/5-amino-6-(5-phosphoribosylamino)uracil reductase